MRDYDRIASVIRYLDQHHREQPTLERLAAHVDLSPHHFHRMFARWAGVTPKDFLQCLTMAHARQTLRSGTDVLNSALASGLSGPGRLHDLCVKLEAASPGEVKAAGKGWTIKAAFAESPFGTCLVGRSPRGICHLSFVESTDKRAASAAIGVDWPLALIEWDGEAKQLADRIFQPGTTMHRAVPFRVHVRGTKFQIKVWRALLRIPCGSLTSYGSVARHLGDRPAARAVGSAVGKNPVAYLIPCHRVIRETGVLGEYRWGSTRKKAMVAREQAGRIHSARPQGDWIDREPL